MARINTNVGAIVANTNLAKSQKSLNQSLQRLSSGLRINSGADDPAGLIASESLRSELAGINQAVDNSSRASNVIATAEGALSEALAHPRLHEPADSQTQEPLTGPCCRCRAVRQ